MKEDKFYIAGGKSIYAVTVDEMRQVKRVAMKDFGIDILNCRSMKSIV